MPANVPRPHPGPEDAALTTTWQATWVAQAREIAVGDRVRIGEGATATDVRVVGLVESPSVVAQASVYVTWPQLLQWHDHLHLGSVAVRGEVGQLSGGAKVQSPEGYVTEKRTELNNNVTPHR